MTEADAAAGAGSPKKQQEQQPPLSKRQRRKHVNPSNTWPQQPKIQSPAARAKANLRVAGLLGSSAAASSLDPKLDLHSPEVKFGRYLGAPEQRKRHLAVTQLRSYLKQRCDIHSSHGISEMDLLKLWKGLWYTLYLADKVPVQQELSKRLAKLLWCVAGTQEEDEYAAQMYLSMCNQEEDNVVVMEEIINTMDNGNNDDEEGSESDDSEENADEQESDDDESGSSNDEQQFQDNDDDDSIPDELIQHCRGAHLAALFVKTFFRTMQREWGKMDKHRIDKFYTLVRLMLHEIFSYMAARHWNRGIIFLFNDVIRDEVLLQVPNGLRCHLIDICMDELTKVNVKAPMPLTEATILDCLDPYFCLAQNSDDSMVHERVMENIFGKLLDEYSVVSEKEEEENDLVMDQVHVGTIAEFIFKLGSDVDTQERYRKPLYDMHKTYMKRLKKVGKDVELEVDSSDDTEEGIMEDKNLTEEVEPPKKRKRKAANGGEESNDAASETSAPVETKQASKKKRKKNTSEADARDDSAVEQSLSVEDACDTEPAAEKKKAKKKKKKRKSSISSDEGSLGSKGDNEEEVITISYSEQKKAAEDIAEQDEARLSSSKKKNNSAKTPDKTLKTPELTSEEKRVKFGRVNHSKSYKASMKALKTVKHTPNKTPEHSILKTKLSSSASTGRSKKGSSKKKARRNKATDYF